jgi:hypothetical protein
LKDGLRAKGEKESMTNKLKFIGAALLALATLPAAVLLFHIHISLPALLMIGSGSIGAFTVTYESFQFNGQFGGGYTGGTTPPTQAQSFTVGTVIAQLNFTDTDTTFTLTHNFNLSAAAVAALRPCIDWWTVGSVQAVGVAVAPILTFVGAANTVTVTKQQATGSGQTVAIAMYKPGAGYGF